MKNLRSKIATLWNGRLKPFLKDPLYLSKWVSDYSDRSDSGRTTVWVNGGYKTLRDDYQGDLFMFLQDMHLGIMPYGRRRAGSYSAKLVPEDLDLQKVIAEALSNRSYRHDISESLEEFVRQTTQSLFFYTEVFFELYCERNDQGVITKIEFYHIYQPSMKKIFGHYFQIIPWSAAKHAHIKAGIQRIPKEKILHIEFPKELGGTRGLRKILKRLGVLSRSTIPDFQMKAMEQNKAIGFDLDRYTKEKYIEIAQLTKKVGWGQRQQRDNEILEYYSMHRNLLYAKTQAIVREHIISKLNTALSGKVINANCKIEAEGLLAVEDVEAEFTKLQAGDLKFVDILNRTSRT